MKTSPDTIYDVLIIGGGASGTALLYALAKYTQIPNILLVEKYAEPGLVNSRASNNSQTLHVGDIETHYSEAKARQVKPAAMMTARYAQSLPEAIRSKILYEVPKMILAVGATEVAALEKRYEWLRDLFPGFERLDRNGIAAVEPAVVNGRKADEAILALYTRSGFAVDFQNLAQSFVDQATTIAHDRVTTIFSNPVIKITRKDGLYVCSLGDGSVRKARVIVVDADSYSLLFAKQLGYGQEFSLIPIAGTFYFSPKLLNGKVYTVQDPKLPFSAVHGDPDVRVPNVTRWGPTARFYPVLEAGKSKTSIDYLRSSGLNRGRTWISFLKILLEPVRFKYLLENMLYELPGIGKAMFIKNVRKIAPAINARDIHVARGYGGMRLQRVDTRNHELQLGEGKIIGDNIIFNMTPSPGASVSLYNAVRDINHIVDFLGADTVQFDLDRMETDLVREIPPDLADVSAPSYVS